MKRPLLHCVLPVLAGCAPVPATTPAAPAPAAFVFPARLHALGTEPFWSLTIDGAQVRYATPEIAGESARLVRQEAGGALDLAGVLAGEAVTVRIVPRDCSDGMSDRRYAYAATVRLGSRLLHGCASDSAAREAPPQRP